MLNNIFFDYLKEREGKDHIVTESGFVVYKHIPELKQIYLSELFVYPNKRKSGIGEFFLDQVVQIGRDLGCTHIACSTDENTTGGKEVKNSLIKRNFKIIDEKDGFTQYYKDL